MKAQHSLVTRHQLLDANVSDKQIVRMTAIGELQRVRRGVFTIPGVARTWPQAALAAVLACGEHAFASHATSARLWEWRHYDDVGFDVTVPRGRWPKVEGVRVHTSQFLDDVDTTTRNLVPCTTFERTLCDMTQRLSYLQLGRVLDEGLRRGFTTLEKVHGCVERLDSGPRRRLTVVQALLEKRGAGYVPGDSNEELRLLDLIREANLPEPVQQYVVRVDGKRYELDFAWPELHAFAEYYGMPWHIGASAVAYDSQRITDLTSRGWRPAIFTDESSDGEIVSALRRLLQVARAS